MVAPPLCGTLLLSPSLLLSFESWCSVELLPETGPAAEAAALHREEERGRTGKAFSKLPLTAATQIIPSPSASSKTLSSVTSHYREHSAGSYHRIPVVTGQGTLPRANARVCSLLFLLQKVKSSFTTSHPFLRMHRETSLRFSPRAAPSPVAIPTHQS